MYMDVHVQKSLYVCYYAITHQVPFATELGVHPLPMDNWNNATGRYKDSIKSHIIKLPFQSWFLFLWPSSISPLFNQPLNKGGTVKPNIPHRVAQVANAVGGDAERSQSIVLNVHICTMDSWTPHLCQSGLQVKGGDLQRLAKYIAGVEFTYPSILRWHAGSSHPLPLLTEPLLLLYLWRGLLKVWLAFALWFVGSGTSRLIRISVNKWVDLLVTLFTDQILANLLFICLTWNNSLNLPT